MQQKACRCQADLLLLTAAAAVAAWPVVVLAAYSVLVVHPTLALASARLMFCAQV